LERGPPLHLGGALLDRLDGGRALLRALDVGAPSMGARTSRPRSRPGVSRPPACPRAVRALECAGTGPGAPAARARQSGRVGQLLT